MKTTSLPCPSCKLLLDIPSEQDGGLIQCPDCNTQFEAKSKKIQIAKREKKDIAAKLKSKHTGRIRIVCPVCNMELDVLAEMFGGNLIECPMCYKSFKTPELTARFVERTQKEIVVQSPEFPRVQTIEMTSKKIKKDIVFAWLGIILGIALIFRGDVMNECNLFGFDISVIMIFAGIIRLIIAKIMQWWHHG